MENILPADKSVGERRSTIEIMNADVMALSRSPALAFVHSPPNFLSLYPVFVLSESARFCADSCAQGRLITSIHGSG